MSSDNLFERRTTVLTSLLQRREKFATGFFGLDQQPPFTHKLNAKDKRAYFQSLPEEQRKELWQQMDSAERAEVVVGP